jgi:hypothetical protein
MAFLDNSGDIILDAVLTDHGRKVLSKGDGSFRIAKFALGDEEINYTLYNANHASGSAYYDLEILQSPVLESFTNNGSSMKTMLFTNTNQELLYLPILKLNETQASQKRHDVGAFIVAVDEPTEGTGVPQSPDAIGYSGANVVTGIMFGYTPAGADNHIRVDQGLDTTEVSPTNTTIMAPLVESSYTIQLDSRLGSIVTTQGVNVSNPIVDDDKIAFYSVDSGDNVVYDNSTNYGQANQTIAGPRGTYVQFKIAASADLQTSTFLFTQLGGTTTMTNVAGGSQSVRYIDTMVRITGETTGYSIDVPVRFVKTIQ